MEDSGGKVTGPVHPEYTTADQADATQVSARLKHNAVHTLLPL